MDFAQTFSLSTTIRPSKPQVSIDYLTIDEAPIPISVQRLIWEKKNAYPYFGLLYLLALRANSILELGIRSGRSTRALLLGLRDSGFGHLTSIDLPELSPVNRKLRASNYRERFQQLFSYNDFRNWLRPRFQTGATWIGDSSTDTTVKRLNRLDFDKYFSYKKSDFFDIEKDWLLDQRFDMVYIDFDPCDFTRLFSHLRNGSPPKTTFVIHNAKRVDEKKGIEWLRNNSISRSDRTFEIGSGLTLFCLD